VKNTLSDKRIIDALRTHYGIEGATLTFLPLGADLNASVYKAETHDQRAYFVKIKRGHHHSSIAIMDLLLKAGIEQIIPLINTLHGQPTIQIDDYTVIVYPFIDGQDGFSRLLRDHQWRALGKTLRQIHDIDVPQSQQLHIRRETYSPKWRNAVRLMLSHEKAAQIGDEIAVKLWAFIGENFAEIKRLVDRAGQLANKLSHEPLKFVLCHSDIHGGNILIDEEDNTFIVDWDEPIMAPKERDLMFIGGGVGNIWNKPHEEEIFYEAYGKTEINRTSHAYYRHERIVEDIAIYSQEVLFTRAKSADKLVMYEHFIAMFDPRGVVEIAFETDKA
jgi:spectinomycin phosphotransferase